MITKRWKQYTLHTCIGIIFIIGLFRLFQVLTIRQAQRWDSWQKENPVPNYIALVNGEEIKCNSFELKPIGIKVGSGLIGSGDVSFKGQLELVLFKTVTRKYSEGPYRTDEIVWQGMVTNYQIKKVP